MQVSVNREIGSLLDVPAVIHWFQTSPAPRWILLGVVVLGIGSTLSRRSSPGSSSGAGGIGMLIWIGLLLGAGYWVWKAF